VVGFGGTVRCVVLLGVLTSKDAEMGKRTPNPKPFCTLERIPSALLVSAVLGGGEASAGLGVADSCSNLSPIIGIVSRPA